MTPMANHGRHTLCFPEGGVVQLPNGILEPKHVLWYGRCFMVNSGTMACPEHESAGETFLGAKNKMAAGRLCLF